MAYSPVNSSQTLAASVSDLNSAFDLLLGLSHSSSAPSSPEAWQPWLDTTTNAQTLKLRNNANTGWIPVFHLESQSGPICNGSNNNTITLKAPSSVTSSFSLTLPDSSELPSSGTKFLKVDSSGTISLVS